jgi:hypothetical protein
VAVVDRADRVENLAKSIRFRHDVIGGLVHRLAAAVLEDNVGCGVALLDLGQHFHRLDLVSVDPKNSIGDGGEFNKHLVLLSMMVLHSQLAGHAGWSLFLMGQRRSAAVVTTRSS